MLHEKKVAWEMAYRVVRKGWNDFDWNLANYKADFENDPPALLSIWAKNPERGLGSLAVACFMHEVSEKNQDFRGIPNHKKIFKTDTLSREEFMVLDAFAQEGYLRRTDDPKNNDYGPRTYEVTGNPMEYVNTLAKLSGKIYTACCIADKCDLPEEETPKDVTSLPSSSVPAPVPVPA